MPNNTMPVRMEDIDQAEGRSFNARVPTRHEMECGVHDYASSLTDLQQAIKHLGRAMPNGQRVACIVALAAMQNSLIDLVTYMRLHFPDIDTDIENLVPEMARVKHINSAGKAP